MVVTWWYVAIRWRVRICALSVAVDAAVVLMIMCDLRYPKMKARLAGRQEWRGILCCCDVVLL